MITAEEARDIVDEHNLKAYMFILQEINKKRRRI